MPTTVTDRLRIAPGERAGFSDRDPGDRFGLEDKDEGRERLTFAHEKLRDLQRRLWAEDERAVLLVLQGMDTAGKDGTIRNVFRGVNPQGVKVASFKAPSTRERDHDYLWRVHQVAPGRGEIGIFNRSHYEDVGVVRVMNLAHEARWRARYRHIREFERLLHDEGTSIVKVFLHISKEEQRERLQARIDRPEKHWKFSLGDLDARERWDEYEEAYEEAIAETSTEVAPWFVVPADRKWVRNVAVAELLVETLERMDPQAPPPDPRLEGLVIE